LNGFTQLEVGEDIVPAPAAGTTEEPTPLSNVQTPFSSASHRIESAAQTVPPKYVVPALETWKTGEERFVNKSDAGPDRSNDSILERVGD